MREYQNIDGVNSS